MSVPRGTHGLSAADERLSVRVPYELKAAITAAADTLSRRGLNTSISELVSLFVSDGLAAETEQLEVALRAHRTARRTPPSRAARATATTVAMSSVPRGTRPTQKPPARPDHHSSTVR